MKAGISLVELAQKIEDNKALKKDFVADTRELRLSSAGDKLAINNHAEVTVSETCHHQIGDRLAIPAKYYGRLRTEAPALLADNVNHWFQASPERRLVRTLGTSGRAFLSDRYQRIDHEEVATMVLPVFAEHKGLEIASCEMTEKKLYIKATTSRIQGEVSVGDVVQAGIIVSNSEIGYGALVAKPFIKRLICKNGMVVPDSTLRAHHVGGRADQSEAVYEMLTDETLRADDRAILLKLRDVVRATLTQEVLNIAIEKFRAASQQKLEGNPAKAIEVLGKRVGLLDHEQGSILRYLIEGGDISRWGVANAVTRYAHDPVDYDRASELESIGGRIIDLPRQDWQTIAQAA